MNQSPLTAARNATRSYHTSYYRQHKLFEPGSWLAHPDVDLERVIALCGHGGGKKCLDLGSGVGRNAIPLARAGFTVTCVDNLPEALDLLRQYAGAAGVLDRIDIEHGEIDDYQVGADTFDVVLAVSCLEHASSAANQEAVLQLLRDCLRPGGVILATMSTNRTVVDARSRTPVKTFVETNITPEQSLALLANCFSSTCQIESKTSTYSERLTYQGRLVDWSSTEIRFLATKNI